ncbi:MAG: penicillin acylase family protein [Mycobacteriales bacterium]
MQVYRPLALTAAAAAAALVASPGLTASAAGRLTTAAAPGPTYLANDYSGGNVYSILPPGENGLVNGAQLAQFELTGTRPPNSQDQLIKYENLLYGAGHLTTSQIPAYYDQESFGVQPQDITRVEQPSPTVPVTIYRDSFDVPHIYGATIPAMEFGAGYAGAEDRLFFMDVLRHYGEGTLSAFLGPSCADEQMDHDQLLLTGYTPAALAAQANNLPQEYGTLGALFKEGLDSYVAGINAYIAATQTNPSLLPADYGAALEPPQPWTDSDIIAIAGLVGGIFGKGGGNELGNAALLQYLEKQLGSSSAANGVFTAFKEQNDPAAPTTIRDRAFPYEIPGRINPATTAMPDNAAAPLTGGPTDTTPNCNLTAPNVPALTLVRDMLRFPSAESNALLVDAAHSTTGHPIAVFGPQVGYFAPEILMEEDLHAPDFAAEGASFDGTNAIVELGRGEDYAWSATSAGTDVVDTRLELVCNPNGGPPAPQGTYYVYDGHCVPMTSATFSETAIPKPGGQGAPVVINHVLYYTIHGVVQGWTTADGGKPVAVVAQRSTYGHELDSGIGFLRWNMPSYTYDAQSWMQGAEDVGYTFNWFYVDDRDIAYYASGKDPVRPSDVNPNLPDWGTGIAEWQGFLPPQDHPHEINPPQGYFTSWNNKPAPEFSASDSEYGYGSVYRSQSLDEAIQQQFALHHGKLTEANLVTAMESAATVDLSGRRVLPALFDYLGTRSEPAGVERMLAGLRTWLAAGAHRVRAAPGDTQYAYASAVASMDEFYPRLVRALFDPLFAAGGVYTTDGLPFGYNVVPMAFANTPNSQGSHLGSAYDGGWEGYLVTLLSQLRGVAVLGPFPPAVVDRVCGPGGPAACPAAIDRALAATYQAMVSANGGSTDVASWTQDTNTVSAGVTLPTYDEIVLRAVGIVGQPNPDWQNRPTFQQVAMFTSHRPVAAAPPPPTIAGAVAVPPPSIAGAVAVPPAAKGELALTGADPALPPVGAGLLGLGLAAVRLRRRRRH